MLDLILATLVIAAIVTFFVNRKTAAVISIAASVLPLFALMGWAKLYGFKLFNFLHLEIETDIHISVAGATLQLGITPISWFFGIMILAIFPAIMLFSYSLSKKNDGFYPFMLLALFAAIGILLSRDMLTFFLFWEMMSWSSFLLVWRNGDRKATISYLVFSAFSAFLILLGILLLYSQFNSLLFSGIMLKSNAECVVALASLIAGFAVKSVLMPLHVWAPVVYSKSDEPFVAFLAGGLSKLGYYGMFVFLFVLSGTKVMNAYFDGIPPSYLLAIFGAISAFIATLLAFMQDDLRKLLAYSSIGQLGYISIGFGIGTPLAISGALFQAFNHTFFKAVLFLAAGAVAYRTGKWKISELGGVAYKMPMTFMAALFAIFTLAAIPITSGFAAKWLLYEAAIEARYIFVAPVMLIAGVGAFLYSFRILYGVFLGGNRHPNIKEAPMTMVAGMFLLVLPLVIFLVFPGKMLDMMAPALSAVGIAGISHTDYMINTGLASYNTLAVIFALLGAMIPAFLIYRGRPHRVVPFEDNYLAAEPPGMHKGVSMHAASHFYKPVEDVLMPFLEHGANCFYNTVYAGLKAISNAVRRVYTGFSDDYVMYIVIFFLVIVGWFIWI